MSGPFTTRPARLAAVGLLAAAAMAAAFAASRVSPAGNGTAPAKVTTLSADLARCRALGAAAEDDLLCRRAWRDSRRRFLGQSQEGPR